MGFWGSIKKEVSRFGRKMGFNRSSKAWFATTVGTVAGAGMGAVAGAAVGGPAGAVVGSVVGGGVGFAGGAATGDQMDAISDANKTAEEQRERAIAMASRTEAELADNNTESGSAELMEDERRKRLAASYSLSRTAGKSAFAPKSSSGRKTIG